MATVSADHEPRPLPTWLPKNGDLMSKDGHVAEFILEVSE